MNRSSQGYGTSGVSLVWMLAKRDLKNRYAKSYAGLAWNVGVPLLYSLINVVVFSVLMRGRIAGPYHGVPFSVFYFVPFSLWSVFTEVTGRSAGILREYAYLINKIAFPSWTLPLVPFASALLGQLILFVIVAVLMLIYGLVPSATMWMIIPIWAASIVLTVGVGYMVSSLAVYVPDLEQLVPVLVTMVFWLTPILYPSSVVRESGALWVRSLTMSYNPFYYMTEASRHAVLVGGGGIWHNLGIFSGCAVFVFALGLVMFSRLRRGFADVL